MMVFELARLLQEHQARGDDWSEFLRVPALSMGLYTLPAGAVDPQQPHAEDEVYYVVGGQAAICVGEKGQAVRAGSIIYVGAGVEHRFLDIEEDLTVLVFFAPAEGSANGRK